MALSTDLSIRWQSGFPALSAGSTSAASGGSFSQALSAAYQNLGGNSYEAFFQTAAGTYQIPLNLLKAVAKAESDFNANAVSHCGAQGIMQLMPATARSLGVTDSFDPAQNIMGGAKYLRQMLDNFGGDVSLAVAAYNAGPNAVKKYGGIPPYRETQNYVTKVLGYAGSSIEVPNVSAGQARTVSEPEPPVKTAASAVTLTELRDELEDAMLQVYRSGGVQEAARLYVEGLLLKEAEEHTGTVRL